MDLSLSGYVPAGDGDTPSSVTDRAGPTRRIALATLPDGRAGSQCESNISRSCRVLESRSVKIGARRADCPEECQEQKGRGITP
jgi:hypothetical protein